MLEKMFLSLLSYFVCFLNLGQNWAEMGRNGQQSTLTQWGLADNWEKTTLVKTEEIINNPNSIKDIKN